MSKLAAQDKFIDFSDYGRPIARLFVEQIKGTGLTPIHVTFLFGVSGLLAVYCMLTGCYFMAAFFIIIKSIIDAADGELARVKNSPSYTGRYLDSIFDIIINLLLFITIWYISKTTFFLTMASFIGFQLQGTLYNYYYVILRNNSLGGDATSKVFEYKAPKAFPSEKQRNVTILFVIYAIFYGCFDRTIHFFDKSACNVKTFPKWFMTSLSIFGLGFQLLIISIMLLLRLTEYIVPFFIGYSLLIFLLIGVRKVFVA